MCLLQRPFIRSDWHLGYPDCGLTQQSPINIAADLAEVVEVGPSCPHCLRALMLLLLVVVVWASRHNRSDLATHQYLHTRDTVYFVCLLRASSNVRALRSNCS